MRGRCERHQLALGPQGCLLCRREAASPAPAAPAAPVPQPEAASPPLPGAGAEAVEPHTASALASAAESEAPRRVSIQLPPSLLLLPFVAAGFYFLATQEPPARSGGAPPRAPVATLAKPAAEAPEPLAEGVEPARPSFEPLVIEEPPAPERRPLGGNLAPPPRAASGDATNARASEQARREAAASELATARERVDVVVYSTSWCRACRSLRGYLAERGIRYTEYDVDHDRAAGLRQRQLNPRGSVPTVDIEGQVLVGFNPRRIEAALDRAAHARLQRL